MLDLLQLEVDLSNIIKYLNCFKSLNTYVDSYNLTLKSNIELEQKYFNGAYLSTWGRSRQEVSSIRLKMKTQELPPQIRRTTLITLYIEESIFYNLPKIGTSKVQSKKTAIFRALKQSGNIRGLHLHARLNRQSHQNRNIQNNLQLLLLLD